MGLLITECPRCGANEITFDILGQVEVSTGASGDGPYEIFCRCRSCHRTTTFVVRLTDISAAGTFYENGALVSFRYAINQFFEIDEYISVRNHILVAPPDYLPEHIESAFTEGAACLSIECFNAAAVMFRLCVDLATQPLLPDPNDNTKPQPNSKQRRDLGLRIPWLFDNKLLPIELKDLAGCIKEDGNDGAHVGNLTKADADDLLDFTVELLERLITEPEKLKLAQQRRDARRAKQ